jgi:SAM-dependent methyltransferase
MEDVEENLRLETKTDVQATRKQAAWCGLRPGLKVLDAGCGTGLVTSILHEMIQPGGEILGVDNSEERIGFARKKYANQSSIQFQQIDVRDSIDGIGEFDLIWSRFFLEFHRRESADIVRNLAGCLKPGGYLCLLDLDHNALNHYEMPAHLEEILFKVMQKLEKENNFDPYVGRKLYAFLYDLGFENIEIDLQAHHLIYGKTLPKDLFNWTKKWEAAVRHGGDLIDEYPGGAEGLTSDFMHFFRDSRRFTYTPLILCKGMKPTSCCRR